MGCVACGADLIPGKRFCHACGARVAVRCTRCGAAIDETFRFCPDCGQSVGAGLPPGGAALADGPPPVPGAADGERKHVTVLFSDFAGTAAAARLDPEEYHQLLEEYLAVVLDQIDAHGGTVNQLAGDGVMALFGAPVAQEDAPRRAVGAALAVLDALGPLSQRLATAHGVVLRARVGINTGPVVVGTVGNDLKMDYTAVGDTTNLAARLQALAAPGTALISESTRRLVRGFFELRAVGPLAVKGRSEPVTAYEVLGRRAAATPMSVAAARGLTPLVGRDAELEQLAASYRSARDGRAQVVGVVGEAGSGKSRLLYEFRLRLHDEPATVLEGRCSSMGRVVPYGPILGILRAHFGVGAGDGPDEVRRRLAAAAGISPERVEEEYPLLCRFLALSGAAALDTPPETFPREVSVALGRLLLGPHRPEPVVLVVEDVHWIDEASHELLEHLLGRLADEPVLLLVSYRPERPPTWRLRVPLTQLPVRPLADAETRAIIRAVAGGALPGALERRLVARAGGSPFFAEEMIRALRDEGYLVCEPAGCRLSGAVDDVPIPGTVQEVIAARLDRLAPETKRVLQVAAVLGRQFRRADVAQLLGGDGIDAARELAALEREGLLHRKHLLSDDELRFGESLTQEVAYEGLLLRHRRQLHGRVAALIEADPRETGARRSAVLAHHLDQTDDHRRAVAALLAAARDAEEIPSYPVAAGFFQRAWDRAEAALGGDDEDWGRRAVVDATLGLARLTVLFGLPRLAEADRAAARGRAVAEALGDPAASSALCYFHGAMTMTRPGEYARGLALAEEGVALARGAGLSAQAASMSRGLASNYAVDGRFEEARRTIEAVLGQLAGSDDPDRPSDLYLSARYVRDLVLYASDELDAAVASGGETLALAERVNNRTIRSVLATLLAQIAYLRGDDAHAVERAEAALELAEAIGNANVVTPAASVVLAARCRLGEAVAPERYLDLIDQGLAAAGFLQLNLRFLADALLAVGDADRALRHVEALQRTTGGRLRQALVALAWGDVTAHAGRHAEACAGYASARALAEAVGARSVLAAALIGTAEVEAAVGRGEARPDGLVRALSICDALGLGAYRARAQRLLGPRRGAVALSP